MGPFRRASLPCGLSFCFLRASVSPAGWVRRRAPEGGWGRVAGAGAGRGSCLTRHLTRSRSAVACQACGACARRHGLAGGHQMARHACRGSRNGPGGAPHPPSDARRFDSLALSDSGVRARRAWTPGGTGGRGDGPARHPCLADGACRATSDGRRAQRGPKPRTRPPPGAEYIFVPVWQRFPRTRAEHDLECVVFGALRPRRGRRTRPRARPAPSPAGRRRTTRARFGGSSRARAAGTAPPA